MSKRNFGVCLLISEL